MTPKSKTSNGGSGAAVVETNNGSNPERERVFSAYRQWGYLEGDLDPLGFLRPRETPELERDGEYAREARTIYSTHHRRRNQSHLRPRTPPLDLRPDGIAVAGFRGYRSKPSSGFSTCSPAPTSSSRSCSSATSAASAFRSKASPPSSPWSTKFSTRPPVSAQSS